MILAESFHNSNPRLRIVGCLIGFGLFVLLTALFHVQVWRGEHYGDREQAQQLRRIRIPSARGDIVDRNGVVLANNRPSYDVVIYLDQLNRASKKQDVVLAASATLSVVGRALGLPVTLTDRDVRTQYQLRRPLPLTVWRDLRPELVGAFVERVPNSLISGMDLIVTPVRQYPQGKLAAHLLGYVGKAEPTQDEDTEEFYYYQPDSVGKQGVERACDPWLRGSPGGRTIRVSPRGTMVGVVGEKAAERGQRVVLTIDAKIQRIVEDKLSHAVLSAGKQLRGAAVLLDPRSGEVLAMASVPSFDPNVFNPGVPAQIVNATLTDPSSPMLNRAIGAGYAPGSTFKPVTLLAGLEAHAISPRDSVVCNGALQIGTWPRPFGCWKKTGHGTVDMLSAMRESCDVWFYTKGLAMGVDAIERVATELGLGQPTGFDIGRDQAGLLPSPEWKRASKGEKWWDGDTATLAIGQSFLLVTPLQMANVAAAFANGGTVWRPFAVKRVVASGSGEVLRETQPEARKKLSASPQNLAMVREAMLAAVQAADGTGHRADVRGLSVAGKTGTAEFDLYEGGARHRINRAWFIGFAPYENPQIAMALVLEDAESGGHTAAPVAGQILAAIFQKKAESVSGSNVYAD